MALEAAPTRGSGEGPDRLGIPLHSATHSASHSPTKRLARLPHPSFADFRHPTL